MRSQCSLSSFVSSLFSGILLIQQHQYIDAVAALQLALRIDPGDASTWEALAAAYQPQGRLTAALKAYKRAMELDPTRVYALIQSGSLHLALGEPSKALECHEKALAADAEHPAALLGAAEALATTAAGNIRLGALVSASKDLEKAADYAVRCTSRHGTLSSAWKRLGDVLLLHRYAPPLVSATPVAVADLNVVETNSSAASSAVLNSWRGRMDCVCRARRIYAKALHLSPWTPNAWLDTASTFYHEQQLRRAHPSLNAAATSRNFSEAAEILLRGALRLDPSAPELWLALGVAATDPGTREYALSRCLQLDPRSTPAWVALARLYIDAGERDLAERCLQQGRSQDPTVASIWEAMAAVTLLSPGDTAMSLKESRELAEHAVGLCSGAEGLGIFAEAGLTSAKGGGDGAVFTAARRAAALMPLNPAAQNAWGLACEVKGDFIGAVTAFRTALSLLEEQNLEIDNSGDYSSLGVESLIAQHPLETRGGVAIREAVKLNLARVLSGRHH